MSPAVATPCVGAYQGPCDRATGRGGVVTAPAANLVTENAANERTENGTANVGIAAPVFRHLLALDPAALLGRSHHGADRRHRGLKDSLIGTHS